jgi:hypothetical protein
MTHSFTKRNSALFTSQPLDPTNINQSFTVADDTERLEHDWEEVEDMLSRMPDDEDDDEGLIAGITDFRYHDDMSDESDEPEPTSAQRYHRDLSGASGGPASVLPIDTGRGKITKSPQVKPLSEFVLQPLKGRQSGSQRRSNSLSQSFRRGPPFQMSASLNSFGEAAFSFMRANGLEPPKRPKPPVPSKSPKEAASSTISVRRNPSSNPNYPFDGSPTKPKTSLKAIVCESSDSDIPPMRYSSPNLRVIDNPVQSHSPTPADCFRRFAHTNTVSI